MKLSLVHLGEVGIQQKKHQKNKKFTLTKNN